MRLSAEATAALLNAAYGNEGAFKFAEKMMLVVYRHNRDESEYWNDVCIELVAIKERE